MGNYGFSRFRYTGGMGCLHLPGVWRMDLWHVCGKSTVHSIIL